MFTKLVKLNRYIALKLCFYFTFTNFTIFVSQNPAYATIY